MKKILAIICIFIMSLSISCSAEYQSWEIKAEIYYKQSMDLYQLTYKIDCYEEEYTIQGIDYEEYGIKYVLAGDVIEVKAKTLITYSEPKDPYSGKFYHIRKVKINRSEQKEFEVILNNNNGKEEKQIVCVDKNTSFIETYTDENRVIFKDQTRQNKYWIYYDWSYLKDLEVGTKLIGTVFNTDEGYGVYEFYLKSFLNQFK